MKKLFMTRWVVVLFCVLISGVFWIILSALDLMSDYALGITLSLMSPAIISFFVVSHILKYHRRVEEQKEKLESLNELNNQLFSAIAHDIRSPITQTKSFLQLHSLKEMSDEEITNHLSSLSTRTDNLLNFIDDILKWTQSQLKNNAIPKFERFSTQRIIEQTVLLNSHRIKEKGIILKLKNVRGEGFGDPDIYAVVIRNILQNAIKFTAAGKSISIWVEEKENKIITVIEDNGVGISNEGLNKILHTHELYTTEGTEEEKGTGLGLKMCFKYAKLQKGVLDLKSQLGIGTSVRYQISAAQAE